jgi:molecular chaperone GrpE
MKSPDEENQGPVIRDRRRIDPVTGQVRDTGQAGQAPPAQRGAGQSRPGRHAVSRPGAPDAGAAGGNPGAGTGGNPGAGPGGARPGPPAGPGSGARAADAAAPAAPGQPAADSPADRPDNSGPGASGPGNSGPGAAAEISVRLAERTADLQRVQAEYANYRKRVERDRMAVREQALSSVLIGLLPVLDDIGRAREHGELTGGFKSVAESLEAVAVKLGLTAYGEDGDPFDPNLHEALMHSYSIEVSEPTCVRILQPGYKVGDRILRPARVAVAEPGDGADETAETDPSYSGRPAAGADDDPPRQADADGPGDHAPTGAD